MIERSGNASFREYLVEVGLGMLTAPMRVPDEWEEVRDGLFAMLRMLLLTIFPLLVVLAPLLALMARRSDRNHERKAEDARARLRRGMHKNGACT